MAIQILNYFLDLFQETRPEATEKLAFFTQTYGDPFWIIQRDKLFTEKSSHQPQILQDVQATRNENNDLYGFERFEQSLLRNFHLQSIEKSNQLIIADVEVFNGEKPFDDDFTLLMASAKMTLNHDTV